MTTTRSASRAATASAISALVLVGDGCEAKLEIRYETAHLRIATDFDAPLCQGDLDHYERVLATLEEQLATSVDGQWEVHLWDLADYPGSTPGWCDVELASGCVQDGIIYAELASIDHELVHIVTEVLGPLPFWDEGAATGLQSKPTVFGWSAPVDNLDLEAPYLNYNTAGHFSRWLLETQGLESYRELLRAPGTAREAFESSYGMSMEAAQEQYYAEAPYSYGALLSCDHPELPNTAELRWSETIELECGNSDIHGSPRGMAALRVLTVTERGYYELTTSADSGAIRHCRDETLAAPVEYGDPNYGDVAPSDGGSGQVFAGPGGMSVLELLPGRYELGVGYADFEARTVELEVRAAPGPVPQTPGSVP